jgi:amidohydrolase
VNAPDLIDIRRHLHQHPELSCQETQTAAYIADHLRGLGLDPQVGAFDSPTSVVATIEGAADGPTLAWRADTDALPIVEATGAPYASRNPGVMHACGHDVHTAIGLGVAASLVRERASLGGRVKMIFQPAEEGVPGSGIVGAEAMARAGVLDGVDAAFACHCHPPMRTGSIGYARGGIWAGSDAFRLTIRGVQSHGAYPQDGVDPIYVAAQLIVALQSIPGRVVDTRQSVVVSVGQVEAGNAFNVIPETASLVGMIRTLDEAVRERAVEAFKRLVDGVCAAHGATPELRMSRGAVPVVNDDALLDRALAQLPPGVVTVVQPQMGAEDFASFSTRCPSVYFMLGVGDPDRGIVHPIHSPRFDVDEACLSFGVENFTEMLLGLGRSWDSAGAR